MAIYTDYVAAAVLYNLQILPESLMCGIVILSIVLANQTLLALAAGAAGTQLLTGAVGSVIMRMTDSAVRTSSLDMCVQGHLGKTWDRLLSGTENAERLWSPKAPSVYMATVGFFAGWGAALQQLYKEEIRAGIINQNTLTTTAIITALIILLTLLFRTKSGCETWIGAIGGILFGLLLGYMGAIALGYATGRRATNIWGIPLLRDRINNGSAVYICPS